jgi:hypothetical protein
MHDVHPDDDESERKAEQGRLREFDCPECSANNPYDDGFGDGDDVRCYYCGLEFRVQVNAEGKLKFREL